MLRNDNWDRGRSGQGRRMSDHVTTMRINELVILACAMSDDDVRALFNAGNPYR